MVAADIEPGLLVRPVVPNGAPPNEPDCRAFAVLGSYAPGMSVRAVFVDSPGWTLAPGWIADMARLYAHCAPTDVH